MKKQRDGAVRVNLWTTTRACVYLSSPIDHHLKQEERGRETRVQFNTLAHEETRQLRGNWTLASGCKGAFMLCMGSYVQLTNSLWKISKPWLIRVFSSSYNLDWSLGCLIDKWLSCSRKSQHNPVR